MKTALSLPPFKTIEAQKDDVETAKHLLLEVAEKGKVGGFVLGLPLHMSGKESEMSEKVRKFGKVLAALSELEVVYWDERLTSMLVDQAMKEQNLSRKDRAGAKDYLSATVLLQSYLDSQR